MEIQISVESRNQIRGSDNSNANALPLCGEEPYMIYDIETWNVSRKRTIIRPSLLLAQIQEKGLVMRYLSILLFSFFEKTNDREMSVFPWNMNFD